MLITERIHCLSIKLVSLSNLFVCGYVCPFGQIYVRSMKMIHYLKISSFSAKGPTSGPTPGGSASLSSGSILLIVFFIVSAVYLIIGAAFMKVKRNALGSEVIPNKNFWTDLPGLVMDGVKLIIYPCSKRSNYQNVV